MLTYTNDESTMNKIRGEIIALHSDGYHCSETLVRALWPYLLPEQALTPTILRMTATLHGGMAESMSSHCGGLTVGLLLIGALYGRTEVKGDARYDAAIARGFWQRFLDEFGTSNCTTLKDQPATDPAISRCTYIMVRSAQLLLQYLHEFEATPIDKEALYYWRVDRTKEPCHEQVVPRKPAEEVKAELKKKEQAKLL
ncbi:MAG: C_GCAxxG_C_C family protein [Chloroflexi bacterium]|nr:C_GCAxxG_C_C family protein [Chloroflexota bacterium]